MIDVNVDGLERVRQALADWLPQLSGGDLVEAINRVREEVATYSPFRGEPVDCVLWVPGDQVHGNDYNPNQVAPPEMRLLQESIMADGYCVEASTPILCADLVWRAAATLQVGDRIIAFDEDATGSGSPGSRRFRTAEVTFNEIRRAELYRVITERGDVLTNAEHPWLARRLHGVSSERTLRWIPTKDLRQNDQLVHIAEPWEPDTTWRSGWLAGFLDGEGSMAQNQANGHAPGYRLSASQRPSPTADRMIQEMTSRVRASVYVVQRHNNNWNDMTMVRVDRFKEVIRLLGTVRPERLIQSGGAFWEGVSIAQRDSRAGVLSVEKTKRGHIASLSTSTKTYIAAGFAMHNTQPVVVHREEDGRHEVVDGFHRTRVAKEVGAVTKRVHGRIPVAVINRDRSGKADRIAATIRHNRARGKHGVDAMSAIVADLAKRNWSDAKIGKELGMEPDEVLRLKQITGLAELFRDQEFSEAWEPR